MRSLQNRLSSGLIVALAVLVGLLLLVGSYSLHHLVEDFVAKRLEHDMDALLAALEFTENGRPLLKESRLNPIFRQPYSGHYYKLRSGAIELRSRSLWDADLAIPATTAAEVRRDFIHGPQQQVLLRLARAFQVQGRDVVIAVTEDFTGLAAGLRQLTLYFVALGLVLLIALVLAQRLIVRRGLKPLEQTRLDILRLARGEIGQLQADAPLEISPLVQEINRLIELMQQRLQRSRHALGNLAHALKRPLTLLTQLAEQPNVREQQELCGELQRQTVQIRTLIERELKRARIAGTPNPGQRVVLAEEVADLVAVLKKIHRDKALDLDYEIPPATLFPGDRDDLLELLGNLLDNACQWARSRVCLRVAETDGWQRLIIEDDGPGCSPEPLELLTRRGVRVDESRAGHGLGLAIVTDIVEQYGGRLRLGNSSRLGGFRVEVEFPSP